MAIFESVTDLIGGTPVIELTANFPPNVQVFGKLEAANPGGSVKDRLALGVIRQAERDGTLKPGQTIVECTSGNVGIAFAMIAAALDYKFVAVMGDSYSVERRKLIALYGGEIILFPGAMGSSGGNRIADDLAAKNGWFRPRQFENDANPAFHKQTTAAEVLSDFAGRRLDYIVAGFGTGGTITGLGSVVKHVRPGVKVATGEPENAAVLQGGEWHIHGLQGLAPNFAPNNLDPDLIDDLYKVSDADAIEMSRCLAAIDGLLVGISSGAAAWVARQVALQSAAGTVILAIFPDTGERYLSTGLTASLPEPSQYEGPRSL